MPRFAANISLLYPEHALLDRISAAASDGFAAVEVQAPYAIEPQAFRRALDDARTQLILLNAPQGEGDERGLAALPGRERDFEQSIAVALDYARGVGVPRVHVMAGIVPAEVGSDEAAAVYCRNLAKAGSVLGAHDITVMIEPINTRDMPGYFLTRPEQAARLIDTSDAPNVRLQFDCYHAQIMGGDLARRLEKHFPLIGHVQIAGVPDRSEPNVGEVNYAHLFALLDRLGYDGWVGCEYRPAGGAAPGATSAGLGWLRSR